MNRDTIREVWEGMNQDVGPPAAKLATAGAAIVGAALWDAMTSVLFTVMLGTWMCDMASGSLRAIKDARGLRGWEFERFAEGFLKAGVAVVAMTLGVMLDVLAVQMGAGWNPAAAATMGMLSVGFGASAAKNVGHFFPAVGNFLGELGRRIPGTHVEEETLRREDEQRRGRRPPVGGGAREMNGTDH